MTHRGSTVIPCLRFHDAHVAIDWLCNRFGSEVDVVHRAGTGMTMPGSTGSHGEWGKRMLQADEIGDRGTRTCRVADVDVHYEHAKAAGAQIGIDLGDQDYGGPDHACRDIAGPRWWFDSDDRAA